MFNSISNRKGFAKGPFLFIVNPNSGTGMVQSFINKVEAFRSKADIKIEISKNGNHSVELAQNADKDGFEYVIAVGGDGSVHEIGVQLVNKKVALGIIPTGSGNGISRHLGISNNIDIATAQILQGNTKAIDIIKTDKDLAIGFCGLGIDAQVASIFAESKKRGFFSYVKLTVNAFNQYNPTEIEVITENYHQVHECYSLIIANISQLGNNAYINPQGIDDDGTMECIVIKKFPSLAFAELASRLFLKNIQKSEYIEIIRAKTIKINNLGLAPFQIDGETIKTANSFTFEVLPKALNVIIP